MNEFTKTELNKIYNFIQHHKQDSYDDMRFKVIEDKIQSMIDNYCEPNPNKPNFTQEQKDFICYQIGDWYLMMKSLLEGQHNLGYMKEMLKTMICDDKIKSDK